MLMKKLSILLIIAGSLFIACNGGDGDKDASGSAFVEPESACECNDRTNELIQKSLDGENVAEEQAKLAKACQKLIHEMGETAYLDQIKVCEDVDNGSINTDTISIDTSLALSITPCECKAKITDFMNRAATGEDVSASFAEVDKTCGELRKYMGELEYTNALNDCR